MFKKAIPFILVSGLVLTACGTNGTNGTNNNVPKNNETPMQNLERDMTPRVNHGAGPNMDGVDNGRNRNNGVNNGVINDGNRNRTNGNEEIIIEDRTGPNGDRIIIEEKNRNHNGNNTNNR